MGKSIHVGSIDTWLSPRGWVGVVIPSVGLLALAAVFGGARGRAEPVQAATPRHFERFSLASLEGHVRSDVDRAPIAGVRVVFQSASDVLTLVTDDNGRFSLALVEPGEIEVRVEPGPPWESLSRRFPGEAGRNEVELVLGRAAAGR